MRTLGTGNRIGSIPSETPFPFNVWFACVFFNFRVQPMSPACNRSTGYRQGTRSEEHTSELQSLMRISYAVFCLKKKKKTNTSNLHKHLQSPTYRSTRPTRVHTTTTQQ